jgi:hypothetical protein
MNNQPTETTVPKTGDVALLEKLINAPYLAGTLARHRSRASDHRLVHDLIRLCPETTSNPTNKLEEWRTVILLLCTLEHKNDSHKNLGHLLRPGHRSVALLEKLQKAGSKRAAILIAQEAERLNQDPINLRWLCLDVLHWDKRKADTWVRWAKAFYATNGVEE